jgi:hypothetical protein
MNPWPVGQGFFDKYTMGKTGLLTPNGMASETEKAGTAYWAACLRLK